MHLVRGGLDDFDHRAAQGIQRGHRALRRLVDVAPGRGTSLLRRAIDECAFALYHMTLAPIRRRVEAITGDGTRASARGSRPGAMDTAGRAWGIGLRARVAA